MKNLFLSAALLLAASTAQGAEPTAKLIFNIIQPPPGIIASIDYRKIPEGGTAESVTTSDTRDVLPGVYGVQGSISTEGSGIYPRCPEDIIQKRFEPGKTYVLTIENLIPPRSQPPDEEPQPDCTLTIEER